MVQCQSMPTFTDYKSVSVSITVRVYEELNDYLPKDWRKKDFSLELKGPATVQSILDILKMPVKKVDLVIINALAATLDQSLEDNDRVAIYPVFESLEISRASLLSGSPLRRPKFITDKHLGGLAQRLRSLGFDVIESSKDIAEERIEMLNREKRILLTTAPGNFAAKSIERVILIKKADPQLQAAAVIKRLDLQGLINESR